MSYVTKILTQLPFGNIIGGPMKAAIEAQALAAKSTIDFIQTVGFKKQDPDALFKGTGAATPYKDLDDGDFGEIRNITFKYKTTDNTAGGSGGGGGGSTPNERTVELTVPILTVVPIPFLRIDELTIDFMAKITEEFTNNNSSSTNVDFSSKLDVGYKAWWSPVNVNFNASISTKHSSTASTSSRFQTEATMNIHVRAVQDTMPAGLNRILTILETSAIKNK